MSLKKSHNFLQRMLTECSDREDGAGEPGQTQRHQPQGKRGTALGR